MSATKPQHTPGNWEVSGHRKTYIKAGDLRIAEAWPVNDPALSNSEQTAAAIANARLISQAPALAEALQATLAALQSVANEAGDVPEWNNGGEYREACKQARQALAAAGLEGGGK